MSEYLLWNVSEKLQMCTCEFYLLASTLMQVGSKGSEVWCLIFGQNLVSSKDHSISLFVQDQPWHLSLGFCSLKLQLLVDTSSGILGVVRMSAFHPRQPFSLSSGRLL